MAMINNIKTAAKKAGKKAKEVTALGALALTPALSHAQESKEFAASMKAATCFVVSTSGPIVPFVVGIAIVVFFVLLTLNEGNQMVSLGIKIMIGASGLVGLSWIMSSLFGLDFNC